MKQLHVIPCGKRKIWDKNPEVGPTIASKAYIGIFHRLCRDYVALFAQDWVILSAKHGFLRPDDIVDSNYDVTFGQNSTEIMSYQSLHEQIKYKQLDQYDELVMLTGKKYKKIIDACFDPPIHAAYPLLNYHGIGYMQQALKQAVEANTPF